MRNPEIIIVALFIVMCLMFISIISDQRHQIDKLQQENAVSKFKVKIMTDICVDFTDKLHEPPQPNKSGIDL